ncbi:protein masquerade-like [Diaphorina citri]|uniref:Protein masquerade-like n=1 Tax=Diaphorina citri TaxID=121845 RepID=A0A1S3DUQ8_DIACI|nr:protein masquerade-like [Diaphorina citri]
MPSEYFIDTSKQIQVEKEKSFHVQYVLKCHDIAVPIRFEFKAYNKTIRKNDANLCKPGLRCCVSKDAYSGTLPPNLVIMERNGTKPNSGSQSSSTTPYVSSTSAVTQTTTSRPQQPAGSKPCHGECVSGLFALFCDDIDTTASCPGDDLIKFTFYIVKITKLVLEKLRCPSG